MARTVIDIDDEALAGAAKELGTATKVDTVNAALREIVARRLRLEFLADAASGSFSHLAEPGERERGVALTEYLLDTSVLTRLDAAPIRQRVSGLIGSGTAAVCAISAAELLRGTRSPEHHAASVRRLGAFHRLPTPDDVWDRVLSVQTSLADRGLHQSVKIPDLLIAAVAERGRVPVLHYDQDFDTIAEITGQRCEWVVPRGSAP